jgi:hypothetical protein
VFNNNWRSREQWAYRRRHPYWDSDCCPFADKYSERLSDHATAEEIAALTTALQDLYRELGRTLRATNLRAAPHQQQRGEGCAAWYRRLHQLPQDDQRAVEAAWFLRIERAQINDLLAKIRGDTIPDATRSGSVVGSPAALVAPFIERRDAAFKAAREQWHRQFLQVPIDDAAWDKELKRRAQIEARGSGVTRR